ncbi:MAG: voltage-gated potassium channel [Thermoleophilaceae bacterium]|nr:voltage-gated potassium channel [Thermoleophilaceae bacterium]
MRAQGTHHARLRDRVAAIVFATIGVDIICGVLAYLFEHDQRGTSIHSFGTAIFWTTTQLLTVSSQMVNPLTTEGRILDVFMEAWAVSVVASLAAAIGSFFVHVAGEPASNQ